jgi:hypothetical protein
MPETICPEFNEIYESIKNASNFVKFYNTYHNTSFLPQIDPINLSINYIHKNETTSNEKKLKRQYPTTLPTYQTSNNYFPMIRGNLFLKEMQTISNMKRLEQLLTVKVTRKFSNLHTTEPELRNIARDLVHSITRVYPHYKLAYYILLTCTKALPDYTKTRRDAVIHRLSQEMSEY